MIVNDPLATKIEFHMLNRHYRFVDFPLVDLVDFVEFFLVSFVMAASSAMSLMLFSAIASGMCSVLRGGVLAPDRLDSDLTGIWEEEGLWEGGGGGFLLAGRTGAVNCWRSISEG